MKVIVTKYLNVRVGKPNVNSPCYQYLAPGSELEVDGNLYPGDMYEGSDQWYKDEAGNYYWSGGVEVPDKSTSQVGIVSKQSYQWFKDLGVEEIWKKYNEYGIEATVAVLDTGYDMNNPYLPEPFKTEIFTQTGASTITIQDTLGHGTFCTSLIVADNPIMNIGIAPHCKILIGKISNSGTLKNFDILMNGIGWAVRSGAEIISISLGLPLDDPAVILQLQNRFDQILQNRNVLILAACGDSASRQIITKEFYPASLDHCISIGTVFNHDLHNITVRSDKTIVHTLGIGIEGYGLNNQIEKVSGTSMSTPIIAGILALAVSYIKQKNNGIWNSQEILSKMIQSGDPIQAFPGKIIANPVKFFKSIQI